MSLTNPNKVVTEERLSEFYGEILPYLGGMPELLGNKISRSDLYSTSEKIVGQWIDSKPLYQKTVNFGALPNATEKTVQHGVSNVNQIIKVECYAYTSTGGCVPVPYTTAVSSAITSQMAISANRTGISITTGTDRSSLSAYVTIQYTKTTDSAQAVGVDTDYSTTEKIVGTWIDGKPLYQKTINCGAWPNNTSKDISTGLSSVKIRNVYGYGYNPSDGTFYIMPLVTTTAANNVFINVRNNGQTIRIGTTADRSSITESYVTIQYTKN